MLEEDQPQSEEDEPQENVIEVDFEQLEKNENDD